MKSRCFRGGSILKRVKESRRSASVGLFLLTALVLLCMPACAAGMPTWTEVPVVTDAALKEGSSVSGSVSSAETSRLYSVDLAETGVLTIGLSGSSATNGNLVLLDSDASTQLDNLRMTIGGSHSLSAQLLKGRYYVSVRRSANDWDFQLSVSSNPSASVDEEPNDTFFEAVETKAGQTVNGCLGFRGNGYVDKRDWWKVEVDGTGLLKIDLKVSSESAKGTLKLYDSSANHRLTYVSFDGSKSLTSSVEYHVAASTFYVEVEHSTGAFEYQMTPSLQPVSVEVDREVNDHHTAALRLVPGSSTTGTVGYFADGRLDTDDWWEVKPDGSGMIIVSASMVGQSEGRGTLQVMSADWQETKSDSLDSGSGKRNASVTLSPRQNMSYYIRVQRSAGAWSYSLNATFAPTQLDRHPSEGASALGISGRVSGQVTSAQKASWHKITVPRNGTLTLSFTSDKDPQAYFRLYDTNAIRTLESQWMSGTQQTKITKDLGPGTYYFMVERYGADFSYSVTASFQEAQWKEDSEPNDLPTLASVLPLGGSTTGHLGYPTSGYADSEDWHKVEVTQNGLLTVELETTSDPSSYLRLYDSNGATNLVSQWVSGTTRASVEYNVAPGVYYVELSRYSSTTYSYKLSSSLKPAVYASDREPNDSLTQAVRLGIKGVAEGHMGYYSNRYTDTADWYYIDIAQNGLLELTFESTSDPQSYLKLYDTDGQKQIVNAWISGGDGGSVSAHLRPGRYFVAIERYSSGYVYSYKLKPTFTPAELKPDREFNDHHSTALDLSTNSVVTGDLGYYSSNHTDTVDWYRVRIPSKSTFVTSFAATGSPGVYLRVHDEALKQLGAQWIDGDKSAGQVKLADIDPGTYYVSVAQSYSGRVYSYVLTTATYQSSDRPSVVTTFPADGERPNSRSLIVVPLAGEIDRNSITQDTVRVTTASGSRISGKVVCPGNTVVFHPDQKLVDGERYSVTLAGTIKNVEGTALGTSRTFSFTPTAEAVIEVPVDASQDRLAGYTAGASTVGSATEVTSERSGPRSATLSVGTAGLGPLSMIRVSVSELVGMEEVVAFRVNDSSPTKLTDSALLATTSDKITISFVDAEGNVVESSVLSAESNPELKLDFVVKEAATPGGDQRISGSVGVAKLGFLNTIRVTISQVSGVEGASRFRVDDGNPVAIGGTAILVTLDSEFTLHIENESGEVLLSEQLPAESNPDLVLVYKGQVELPPNHVLVGDTAISIDLFFDQPQAAGERVNEALMGASDPSILVYIDGSEITDAFTGEAADEAQVESMRENLKYIVNSNNEKQEI